MVGNEADRIPRPIRAERDPRPAGQLLVAQRLGHREERPSTAASRPPFSADFYPEKNPQNSSLNRTLHLHARDELGRRRRRSQNREPQFSSGIPLFASRCVSMRKRRKEPNTLDRDRTCNLQLRRLTLYPIELRGRDSSCRILPAPGPRQQDRTGCR